MRLATAMALLAAMSAPALAHPGSHGEFAGKGTAVQHFVSSPFHIAMIAIVLLTMGLLANEIRNRKARQTKKSR